MSDKHETSTHLRLEGDPPTTGHVWDDDLGDFATQPPKWWMLGLLASALWVVAYWVIYPSVPIAMAGMHWTGVGVAGMDGKWTAIKELAVDQARLDKVRGPYEEKIKNMTPAAILADRELLERRVIPSGRILFADNCAGCHGQNGKGSMQSNVGFKVQERGLMAPILGDDDWLYGGTIDNIHETITGGRQGIMVAHKDMLSAAEIDTLANAIAQSKPTSTPLFAEKGCVACHGEDGKGIQAMGSANLTDKIWRFDGSLEGIKHTITYGVNSGDAQTRVAQMPSFKALAQMSDAEIKKLAVYVYKLGGGQADAPVAKAAPAAK